MFLQLISGYVMMFTLLSNRDLWSTVIVGLHELDSKKKVSVQ